MITFPQILQPYFDQVEVSPAAPLDERVFYANLVHFLKDVTGPVSTGLLAETTAFQFLENYTGEPSVWGIYYQPQLYRQTNDQVFQSPDIDLLTLETLDYWGERASVVSHPVLRARYSGLVIDFLPLVAERKAPIATISICINALTAIVEKKLAASQVISMRVAARALQLSQVYNRQAAVKRLKELVLAHDEAIPITDLKNVWASSFDILVGRKPALLSTEEELRMVKLLENRLTAILNLDPWASKAAAERLADYYHKKGLKEDVKRILYQLGASYDTHTMKVPSLQVAAHLKELMQVYRRFHLNGEAEGLMVRIRAASKKADEEFKKVIVEQELETSELVWYANKILKYDGDLMYQRIIHAQLMTTDELSQDLDRTVREHPIQYLMTTSIVDRSGRILATLDPYLENKEGHLVNHYYRFLQMNGAILLHFIFAVGIRDKRITLESVIEFLKKSCIIKAERYGLIQAGVKAFFDQDHIVCIHLLIPQFEEALRNLLEANGGNVLTFKNNSFPLKTFLHVLEDPIIEEAFGQDQVYYFKMLFTDPRGWNLRNQVAHGLLEPELFNQQTAERLMHAFLCLGIIRWKEVPVTAA